MFPKPAECSIAETWTGWSEIMNGEGGFNIYLDGSQGSPRIYEYTSVWSCGIGTICTNTWMF